MRAGRVTSVSNVENGLSVRKSVCMLGVKLPYQTWKTSFQYGSLRIMINNYVFSNANRRHIEGATRKDEVIIVK